MSAEQRVIEVLADRGLVFEDAQAAADLAAAVVDAVRVADRRERKVRRSQCGAPTNGGWACRNERLPGNSGCALHSFWRERG